MIVYIVHVFRGRHAVFDHRTMASSAIVDHLAGWPMRCSWCNRPGVCQHMPTDNRQWRMEGLWIIGGIGLLCNKCDDYGDPPHARYVQGLLKPRVSITSAELIAAYTYPVYAATKTLPVTPVVGG